MSSDQLEQVYTMLDAALSAQGMTQLEGNVAVDELAQADGQEGKGEEYFSIIFFGSSMGATGWFGPA